MGAKGAFWFETGAKPLAKAATSPATHAARSASRGREFDLVVEGEAAVVTDPPTVAKMAAAWAAEGWPADGRRHRPGTDRARSDAPSAGPPPWFVYRLTPRRATALRNPREMVARPGGGLHVTMGFVHTIE